MKIIDGEKFYTTGEIAALLKVNLGLLNYRIRNNIGFPESIYFDNVNIQHWSEDQLDEIKRHTRKYVKMNTKKRRG